MATWIKATLGSHDEQRLSLRGRPTLNETWRHSPDLGQHEDSPQHPGLFFPLSSGWQQPWPDEPDSHLR